jgi:hypothetical protein
VLGLSDHLLVALKDNLKMRMKEDDLIILNPTLQNIWANDIYKLEHGGQIYYIPLWHDEISYELPANKTLFVKCVPDLPPHISIDQNNDLHLNIGAKINEIFNQTILRVPFLEEKELEIPIAELKICPQQYYYFYKAGIARIELKDVFNIEQKGNIIVHLTLSN